ncbi:MAG: hypothetical protein EBU46_00675 [Nitrosomonadaceae bacterium]|nr:hypothetical protein [Nitrosomonadaceae bacterium]
MKWNLDQTTDYSYRQVYAYLRDYHDTPEFVKQAELDTEDTVEKLSENSFADRYHKAFPIHSPASTYVSTVFFKNKQAELTEQWGEKYVDEVATRLNKAAELHGIVGEIGKYQEHLQNLNAAGPEERFVASVKHGEESFDLYPFKTKEDLVKAAESFNKDIQQYPFEWRFELANNFVKYAEEFGIEELPDLLCKYAGIFFPDTRLFGNELTRRLNKISQRVDHEKYNALQTDLEKAASMDDYFAICKKAHDLEQLCGAYDYKSLRNTLGDIVDRTFTLNREKVAALLDVVDMAGEPYQVAALQKVSKDLYKEAFGVDIDPSNVSQLRDVLPTMPLSDVALFRELSGIAPAS